MKFFWWYVIGFVSVLIISSYLVSIREEDFSAVVIDQQEEDDSFTKNSFSNTAFVEYHVSEDIIRKSTNHQMKSMQMIDENGNLVAKDFEPTQVFPVYYLPGLYLYGASAYIPTYEDSIQLSEVKPLLKREFDYV